MCEARRRRVADRVEQPLAAALSEDECAGDEVGAAAAAVVTRMSKWTSLLDSEYEVAADKALQGAALIGKDVIVQHAEGNWVRGTVSTAPSREEKKGGKTMYSIQFNSERGKPARDFGLVPRDMHGSWVIVAPKPLPKVRTHADLDCAYRNLAQARQLYRRQQCSTTAYMAQGARAMVYLTSTWRLATV